MLFVEVRREEKEAFKKALIASSKSTVVINDIMYISFRGGGESLKIRDMFLCRQNLIQMY